MVQQVPPYQTETATHTACGVLHGESGARASAETVRAGTGSMAEGAALADRGQSTLSVNIISSGLYRDFTRPSSY